MNRTDHVVILVAAAVSRGESLDDALAFAETALVRIEARSDKGVHDRSAVPILEFSSALVGDDRVCVVRHDDQQTFITHLQEGILELLIDRTADQSAVKPSGFKRTIMVWSDQTPDSEVYGQIRALRRKLAEIGLEDVIGSKRNHGFYLQNVTVKASYKGGTSSGIDDVEYEFGSDCTLHRVGPVGGSND